MSDEYLNLFTARKYNFFDYLRIPFQIAPIYIIVFIANEIFAGVLPSVNVIITARFIDAIKSYIELSHGMKSIIIYFALMIFILVYQYLNRALMSFIGSKFRIKLDEQIAIEILTKRSALKYENVENDAIYELVTRVCNNVTNEYYNGLFLIFQAVNLSVTYISLLIILFMYTWWSALFMLIITIPILIVSQSSGKRQYKSDKQAHYHNCRSGYLHDVHMSREHVYERTLFSYTKFTNEKWKEQYSEARKINLSAIKQNLVRTRGMGMLTLFIFMLIVFLLIDPLYNNIISLGVFIALVQALLRMSSIISNQLSRLLLRISRSNAYIKDFSSFALLQYDYLSLETPRKRCDFTFNKIVFDNVSFTYPNTEHKVLNDFCLTINKNTHYAIVGKNGAGKTTVTKLLTGLYDNYEGNIYIDGKEIRQFNADELKSYFSVVYQDFAQYAISIEDNVRLGDINEYDESRINRALDETGLKNKVLEMESGVKTVLGKLKADNIFLSGGEWQRLALARALYSNAPICILDEPTAALDPIAESKTYEMFSKLSHGRSTLFITHRLGAAKISDEIIVIDEGFVMEQGSHDELIKLKGLYAEMFEKQRSWYL